MGGVDLKTKGKTVRASRRKSSSDERSRWKFFSSRELLFAESPPFFFPPFFVSTAFTDEREREREGVGHDDAIKRKLAALVYGGSARGIGLGVLCTGSGFTRFQLRILTLGDDCVRSKHDAEIISKGKRSAEGELI